MREEVEVHILVEVLQRIELIPIPIGDGLFRPREEIKAMGVQSFPGILEVPEPVDLVVAHHTSAIGGGSELWDTASWFRKDGSRHEVVTALMRLGEFERDPQPPEEWFFYRNGHDLSQAQMVKGAFLRAFEAEGGLQACGYPTSGEIAEGDLTIQGFEKLTLEMDASGEVHVRGGGAQQIRATIPSAEALLRGQELSEPLIAAATVCSARYAVCASHRPPR